MLKVDSHQHFWIFDPVRDSWITESMHEIRRDFLPEDLKPIFAANDIGACVAVQADQSEAETLFLLELTENNSFIKGVVGWVDLLSPYLTKRLEHYQAFPKLRGFRHIVQTEEPGFMLKPAFLDGISVLKDFGYTYDILISRSQIKEASKLVQLNPDQKFVLDHLGKPDIKSGQIDGWASDIAELSIHDNVYCKLSGLVTEADHLHWQAADLMPYMEIALDAFGAKRLMFGSDWPVCNLAAEYKEVNEIMSNFVQTLNADEEQLIWAGNAIEFYSLDMDMAKTAGRSVD